MKEVFSIFLIPVQMRCEMTYVLLYMGLYIISCHQNSLSSICTKFIKDSKVWSLFYHCQWFAILSSVGVGLIISANVVLTTKKHYLLGSKEKKTYPNSGLWKLISPSVTYIRQWIMSALLQIMACRQFGAKPLSKPILGYCQLDP